MVRLHNTSQDVDSNLCVDAGLETPLTVQKCGHDACPRWVTSDWSSCHESRCFTWHTGELGALGLSFLFRVKFIFYS